MDEPTASVKVIGKITEEERDQLKLLEKQLINMENSINTLIISLHYKQRDFAYAIKAIRKTYGITTDTVRINKETLELLETE